jgi:hypothetical protein
MFDVDTSSDNDGENYLVTGVVLTCDGGISVAPNLRITSYENGSESETEYKVNFQFKF